AYELALTAAVEVRQQDLAIEHDCRLVGERSNALEVALRHRLVAVGAPDQAELVAVALDRGSDSGIELEFRIGWDPEGSVAGVGPVPLEPVKDLGRLGLPQDGAKPDRIDLVLAVLGMGEQPEVTIADR